MNTANLQLEGLYLAVAAINNALVVKGLLSRDEVDEALSAAEQNATTWDRGQGTLLSGPNREAVAFPVRLLRLANNSADNGGTIGFAELARTVGQLKDAEA